MITDGAGGLAAGAGCPSPRVPVTCATAGITTLNVDLHERDDTVTVTCAVKLAAKENVHSLRARFLRGAKVVATARAPGARPAHPRQLRRRAPYTLDGHRVTVRQRLRVG